MTYAYDNYIQLPTVDLYDTLMMAMAINAAKDMYDKGQLQVKDFYKEYGDFMSPFAKDMKAYGNMMGGVRNLINTAYANGIDLLRSPEGRALISKAVYSVDPGKFNLMRSNAKTGYAYLDAMQKLRSLGKYSEAQELYDIMLLGGTKFSDFSTFDENGTHVWDRTSPIEATSLLDLTYDSYKNRTPRDLTAADFIESNGLTPSMFDKRYLYTGFLNSDLMKLAPGAAMSIAADPRAAYFRDLAEQKVAARGGNYTQADVDAQFYRDIADANRWALVDPTKKADEYAKMAQQAAYAERLEGIRAANDREIAQIKAATKSNETDGAYSATTNMAADAEGSLRGQLTNYGNAEKMEAPNQEFGQIGNLYLNMLTHPDRWSESLKKYIAGRAKELGIDLAVLTGNFNKAESIVANKKIGIGMEGVADQVLNISNKASGFLSNTRNRVNELNTILHDLSATVSMSTISDILKEFNNPNADGGFTIPSGSNNRLCGIGEVMKDVLSRGNADGKKHASIDKAIKDLTSGNLSKWHSSWTAGNWDLRNSTNWTGDVYPTGNIVAGDKYYYIEVADDKTDYGESCWFKVERNKVANGGINPALSSIAQRADDAFLKEYSHTNVIGNLQSLVQKHNK